MSRPFKTSRAALARQSARRLSPRRRRQSRGDAMRAQLTSSTPRVALSVGVAVAGAAAGVLSRRRRQAATQQEPVSLSDASVNGRGAPLSSAGVSGATGPSSVSGATGPSSPGPSSPPAPSPSAGDADATAIEAGAPNESAPGHEVLPAPEPGTTSAEGNPDAPNEGAAGYHPNAPE